MNTTFLKAQFFKLIRNLLEIILTCPANCCFGGNRTLSMVLLDTRAFTTSAISLLDVLGFFRIFSNFCPGIPTTILPEISSRIPFRFLRGFLSGLISGSWQDFYTFFSWKFAPEFLLGFLHRYLQLFLLAFCQKSYMKSFKIWFVNSSRHSSWDFTRDFFMEP